MNILPVNIQELPHWRVNFRPTVYADEPPLGVSQLKDLVQTSKVKLRGWEYPYFGLAKELTTHNNCIQNWVDFHGHIEYWRFYQSFQFIHLFSIREIMEPDWDQKLRQYVQNELSYLKPDMQSIKGCLHIGNTIYTITEVFEFISRLLTHNVIKGKLEVIIELVDAADFVLSNDFERAMLDLHRNQEQTLSFRATFDVLDLISRSNSIALESIIWFFERFNWTNPPIEILARDQEAFLKGRR